jgi:hypothetical protein
MREIFENSEHTYRELAHVVDRMAELARASS